MANPGKGQHKSANVGRKQREVPDPVAWMKAHMGPNEGSPGEEAGESKSLESQEQAFGIDKPTQGDSKPNGFANVNSHGGAQHGNPDPASASRGSGGKSKELSPNNTKKAGSMAKRGPDSHPGLPSRNALARRLHPPAGQSKASSARDGRGRTGILSHFEGGNKNNSKAGFPQSASANQPSR